MKKLLVGLAISVSTIGLAGAQTVGAPPPLIPFSGTMTAASGAIVSAMFSLYEEPEGGVPLWVDIQVVQTDSTGGYLALLGAATELPVDLFATSQALWLGVQPEGQAEQPRVQFISVPYALKASDADTLGGRPLADFVLLSGENGAGEGNGDSNTADVLPDASGDDKASTKGFIADLDTNALTVTGFIDVGTTSVSTGINSSKSTYFNTDSDDDGVGEVFLWGTNRSGTTGGTELMRLEDTGFLQIGTPGVSTGINSPKSTYFNIDSDNDSSGGEVFLWAANRTGTSGGTELMRLNETGFLQLGTASLSTGTHSPKSTYFNIDSDSNATGEVFLWGTNRDSTVGGSELMRLEENGDLTITGDLVVAGNVAAKYQDVAEWVEAVGAPTAGTVVVVDRTGRNRVREAEAPYDMGVLGAVSPQPGLVLGEPGPNRVLVAQSGRVKIKVDASYGAISTGDLLTTSSTPGHAMRSDPLKLGELSLHRPGTVLGKALEPLHTGRGEILVLITLQ